MYGRYSDMIYEVMRFARDAGKQTDAGEVTRVRLASSYLSVLFAVQVIQSSTDL